MAINYDDIEEVKLELKKEKNNLIRKKIKINRLKKVIKAHKEGIYNPELFEELMKRSKEVA